MGEKTCTWPASVCPDPSDSRLWNVRRIDGVVVFTPGLADRAQAQQACDAVNEHFDHGTTASGR